MTTTNPQPGDILSFDYRDKRFIAKAIQWVTGSRFTHSGTYLGNGLIGEACAHGYRINEMQHYHAECNDIAVLHFPGTDEQRAAVLAECRILDYVQLRYNYLDIAALLLAHLGVKAEPIMSRLRAKDTAFCSQSCAMAWEIAGVELTDKPYWLVTPADLAHLAGAQG